MRPFVFLLAAGWLIGPGWQAHAQAPKKYAVLVGVNSYQHENLKPLKFAVNDATDLAAVLRKSGYEVHLLSDEAGGKDEKSAPTRANIETQFKTVLGKSRRADTVFIALAGHGVQFENGKDAFFCPADARPFPDRGDSMISLGNLYQDLEQSFAGVKVLLVDACRDDPTAARGGRGVDADSVPRPPRGVAALFSCSAGERAFEHDSLKHGIFFHHVLEGLKGGVRNGDGDVTFTLLADYVQSKVATSAPKIIGGGAKQSPNLKADLSGASPVLLRVANVAVVNAEALVADGAKYLSGDGVSKDELKAYALFFKAAELNDAAAQVYIGYMFDNGLGVAKNDVEAVKWYRKAADQNHLDGLHNLGVKYEQGRGIEKDEAAAARLYRKAVENNHANSQNRLGSMYAEGRGVEKDDAEAIKWYRNAANQNHSDAQFNLGAMFADGRGIAKNEIDAVKWYRKSAEQNYALAQNNLGVMYENGRGVKQDYAEAMRWYRKAADQDNPAGQHSVGWMFSNGFGVTRNDPEAMWWYRKAADQCNSDGQNSVGYMYEHGRGVAKDDSEAFQWYRKAAMQEHSLAQSNLGLCYQYGRGVGKDVAEAVRWFRKAARQGDKTAFEHLRELGQSP